MKAAVIYENGGPDVLRYEDVPDPECPDGCVLIDVEAISIEGGDLLPAPGRRRLGPAHRRVPRRGHGRRGRRRRRGPRGRRPGREPQRGGIARLQAGGSGDVHVADPRRVGRGSRGVCPGRVRDGPGVPVHRRQARGRADRPDSRRGGGVGMAAIQLAKQAGATVISTASSDEKLERLKEFGLDHGINYAAESFVERTRELTDGRGADVILDSIGGQNLVDSIGALAYRGTLVSVGIAGRAARTSRRALCGRRTTRCAASSSAERC